MVTACADNVVLALDGQPALAALLSTLGVSLSAPQTALSALRSTLVGITSAGQAAVRRTGHFGAEVLVRHIIGIDPQRQGVAVGEALQVGDKLAFCQRDVAAARVDLVRICAEIREEMDETQRQITGAVYVSCIGRGGPHFGAPSAEMQIVRHALGDVPLVGFFAGGEIAHQHLYGYTGVLTVFAA
jgi:small ligand-binding sensory domain FIST